MVGAGIFALPSAFGRTTGGLGALIAWCIAGTGMLMLAFVFQTLSRRKPDLDAGIYAYAKAGFGNYLGFSSAVGYWIACCLADTACLILIKATLGQFFPVFGDGTTIVAIVAASILLWGVHFLVLRGVKEAAALNTIATIAKIVPTVDVHRRRHRRIQGRCFCLELLGWRSTQLCRAWPARFAIRCSSPCSCSSGIEGASVYSRYAKKREDVGIATVLGFLGVLCLLVLVTMFSYGILLRKDLAALATPSMAGVMEAIVGPWGAVFVSIGLLISVLGNYLSWSLLAAEVLHSAAKSNTMPSFLARENANKVPAAALWMTNIVIQAFLIVAWFADYAFTLALKMTSSMTLIPYLLVAAYALKLAWTGETYADDGRGRSKRLGARRHRHGLRRRDDLCRRPEVRAAGGAALRARHDPVLSRSTRAEAAGVQGRRGDRFRSDMRRGDGGAVRTRFRRDVHLGRPGCSRPLSECNNAS